MSLFPLCARHPEAAGTDGLVVDGHWASSFGSDAAVACAPLRASLPKFIKVACKCCIIDKLPADSLAAKLNAWHDATSNAFRVSLSLTAVVGVAAVPPWEMLHTADTRSGTHRGMGKASHT